MNSFHGYLTAARPGPLGTRSWISVTCCLSSFNVFLFLRIQYMMYDTVLMIRVGRGFADATFHSSLRTKYKHAVDALKRNTTRSHDKSRTQQDVVIGNSSSTYRFDNPIHSFSWSWSPSSWQESWFDVTTRPSFLTRSIDLRRMRAAFFYRISARILPIFRICTTQTREWNENTKTSTMIFKSGENPENLCLGISWESVQFVLCLNDQS